jgi:hypothetical protein
MSTGQGNEGGGGVSNILIRIGITIAILVVLNIILIPFGWYVY